MPGGRIKGRCGTCRFFPEPQPQKCSNDKKDRAMVYANDYRCSNYKEAPDVEAPGGEVDGKA